MATNEEIIKDNVKILIVEDEEDQRLRLKYVLESEGYKVEEADTGDKAIDQINKNNYDLVITDLRMPGKSDGLDVLRNVKKIKGINVIIVTAYGTIDTAVQAMINGAFDYIQKPISMPELRIKIERAILNKQTLDKLDQQEKIANNAAAVTNEINQFKVKLTNINDECQKILKSIDENSPIFDSIQRIISLCKP